MVVFGKILRQIHVIIHAYLHNKIAHLSFLETIMRLTGTVLSNYFKRYIEREMYKDVRRRTWRPVQGWKEVTKRKWYYGENRPWTTQFQEENADGIRRPKIYVQPIKNWTLLKGDRVSVQYIFLLH